MPMSRMWSYHRSSSYMIDKRWRNRETRQSDAQEEGYIVTHTHNACISRNSAHVYISRIQKYTSTNASATYTYVHAKLRSAFYFGYYRYNKHLPLNFNCCFTVNFDKYKIILPTNALFIET
jgi:hypothetical protein